MAHNYMYIFAAITLSNWHQIYAHIHREVLWTIGYQLSQEQSTVILKGEKERKRSNTQTATKHPAAMYELTVFMFSALQRQFQLSTHAQRGIFFTIGQQRRSSLDCVCIVLLFIERGKTIAKFSSRLWCMIRRVIRAVQYAKQNTHSVCITVLHTCKSRETHTKIT